MDNIQTGLMVSLVGLTVTFFALFIFIGVILLLQKLFPPKTEKAEVEEVAPAQITADASDDESSEEAMVAAIAAAAYLRARRSDQLGAALLAGPGPYRTSRQ